MIVVDASAVLELLLRGPRADEVGRRVLGGTSPLAAPHLLDLEVAQVLRRLAARGQLPEERAAQAFEDLAALPITRYAHEPLLPRIWASRDNLTAYGAAYLALAEAAGATLVTCDAALGAAPGRSADGIVVARLRARQGCGSRPRTPPQHAGRPAADQRAAGAVPTALRRPPRLSRANSRSTSST